MGPNPTDRAKSGTKRSILTDERGVPLGIAVAGANRPDAELAEATLWSCPLGAKLITPEDPQNLCLDKGYDWAEVREVVAEHGLTPHIRSRGEEARDLSAIPEYRARRWVVERTHSWMNRYRRLLVRWEKRKDNYLALLQFVAGILAFRAAGIVG